MLIDKRKMLKAIETIQPFDEEIYNALVILRDMDTQSKLIADTIKYMNITGNPDREFLIGEVRAYFPNRVKINRLIVRVLEYYDNGDLMDTKENILNSVKEEKTKFYNLVKSYKTLTRDIPNFFNEVIDSQGTEIPTLGLGTVDPYRFKNIRKLISKIGKYNKNKKIILEFKTDKLAFRALNFFNGLPESIEQLNKELLDIEYEISLIVFN